VDDREAGQVSVATFLLGQAGRRGPRPLWRALLGLALGLILLAVVVRGVDIDAVGAGLREADGLWVALALGAVLATTAAKVVRWGRLFPASQRPERLRLGRALLVGQMVNALLPARVGEVARAYLSGGSGGSSRATALGTIAAEKVFDVFFLLICAALTAALASLPAWLDVSLAALAALGGCILAAAVALPEKRILAWIERWRGADPAPPGSLRGRCARLLPEGAADWLAGVVRRGLMGLAGLRNPRQAVVVCAWSGLIWALAAGTNYVLFRAFHLELSVGAALLLLTVLHVGMTPPSSPGRLGVFHALTVVGLEAFDVDRASGLAYATVLHAIVYAPQFLLGSLALGLGRRSGTGRR
jgi:uncharacterized membrane protein YbhN (UPF0104 family)